MTVTTPPDSKHKRYVTIKEATELLNIAERSVFRMIEAKRLASMKMANGSRWVDLDDIERELQEKPHSASPVKHTLEHVLALVETLQEAREKQDHRLEMLEQQVAALQLHTPQEVPSD